MSRRDEALAVIEAEGLGPLLEHARAALDDDPGHDIERGRVVPREAIAFG